MIPTRCKTHYSRGLGVASPRALVDRAADLGLGAVIVTDVETMAAQPAAHARGLERGVQVVTGVELRADRQISSGRLIALARDREGYETLCAVVSRRSGARAAVATAPGQAGPKARAEGGDAQGTPGTAGARDPLDAIPEGSAGLFLLTDDPAMAERLLARPDLHPKDLRLLLTRPAGVRAARREEGERARRLAGLSRRHGLRLMADLDVNGLTRDQRGLRGLLGELAGGPGATGRVREPLRWMRSPEEARRLFEDAPEAWREARRVVEQCRLTLAPGRALLPAPDVPPGASPLAFLRAEAQAALSAAVLDGRCRGPAYTERLERELVVVGAAELAPYFLVVREVVRVAERLDVPLLARGSAGASLLAHLLGVTSVDPVEKDLLFERFLNVGRRGLPDVDLDVCSVGRDELIDGLFERFGPERTAQIAAYQTVGRRTVLRDGLNALGATAAEAEQVRRTLPPADLLLEWDEASWRAGLARALEPTSLRGLSETLADAVGAPTHLSVHPGGLVLTDGPVERHAPLALAPKGLPVVEYDLESASWIGLVKIDLLGNRALTQVRVALEEVRAASARTGHEGAGDETSKIIPAARRTALAPPPASDPRTLALLRSADTVGIFQLETPPVREVLSRFPVSGEEDVMAALAIVRPGPASGAARSAFLRRARGEEAPTPPHGDLEGLLDGSRGLLLYEDDIVRALAKVAGIALSDADRVRSHLQRLAGDEPALQELEVRFVAHVRRRGGDGPAAARLWRELRRFADYSFNKAHAASYAGLAYRCAFLKAHEPAAFACAVLDHYGGSYPLRTVAADVVRSGIRVLAPHAAASAPHTRLEAGAVRLGLKHVKGLSARTTDALIVARAARPFADLADLVRRVVPGRRELVALVLAGALDDLAPLEGDAYPVRHEALVRWLEAGGEPEELRTAEGVRLGLRAGGGWDAGAGSSGSGPALLHRALVRCRNELRFLSVHPSAHPMALLRPEAAAAGAEPAAEVAARGPGEPLRFVGIVAASRRIRTARGRTMHFITFEDETGLLEATVGEGAEAGSALTVTSPGPWVMDGRRASGGLTRVEVERVWPFHHRLRRQGREGAPLSNPRGRARPRRPSRSG